MLSQSCTGLSPLPDHIDTHFPAAAGMGPPPPHHHPGLGLMMQGHFGYGPHSHSQCHSQSQMGTPGTPPHEQTVSSSGIPYTPQASPAKQQQTEFQASPVKGRECGGGGGSPARSAYGSSPMRYPGTPSKDGYILPSPAKQLFPAESGGTAAYQSQYGSGPHYGNHQSDHVHHNHHHVQGYGYGQYQQSAALQPSVSGGSNANQYGSLV